MTTRCAPHTSHSLHFLLTSCAAAITAKLRSHILVTVKKRMSQRIRNTRRILLMAGVLLLLSCLPYSTHAASINVPPISTSEDKQEETQQHHNGDGGSLPDEGATTTTTPEQPAIKTAAATTKESPATACRWGEHCPDTTTAGSQKQQQHDNTSETEQHHLPFIASPKNTAAAANKPPEGFVISSRVYTDPDDKLAHFDSSSRIVLEYRDCGASGSTTSPLKVKNAYFRHAMPRAAPHLWSGTEYGTHPTLLIALKPLELLLNSGEEQVFQAGDVILLEDVLSAGHKIRSLQDQQDLSALLLTLPQHYHHVGKDRVSLTTSNRNKAIVGCETSRDALIRERVRKTVFAGVGLGISSVFAVFLGKVAPLWLSVGVGGICFITGGTYAAVQCGEYIWQEGELALERRRLKAQYQEDDDKTEQEEQLRTSSIIKEEVVALEQ